MLEAKLFPSETYGHCRAMNVSDLKNICQYIVFLYQNTENLSRPMTFLHWSLINGQSSASSLGTERPLMAFPTANVIAAHCNCRARRRFGWRKSPMIATAERPCGMAFTAFELLCGCRIVELVIHILDNGCSADHYRSVEFGCHGKCSRTIQKEHEAAG
jgi:hypothetical protein